MAPSVLTLMLVGLLISQACAEDDSNGGAEQAVHKHNWHYNIDRENSGPDQWQNLFPDDGWCDTNKRRQSPINIELGHVEVNSELPVLSIEVGNEAGETSIKNNGHSAVVSMAGQEAFLNGGGLKNAYRIEQFHFHWGGDANTGSEHLINNKHFPLEMHMVTYNFEDYDNILAAAGSGIGDALAVVGTLFEISEENNPDLDSIISHLADVTNPSKTTVPLSGVDLGELLPKNLERYYTYPGSLTTPFCFETVTWFVLNQTQTISANQLDQFRTLFEGAEEDGEMVALVNNFRPVQPLYGRKVQSSFSLDVEAVLYRSAQDGDGSTGSIITTSSASLITALISASLMMLRLTQ